MRGSVIITSLCKAFDHPVPVLDKYVGAKWQPSQPWCVGTTQLTSEADAASKPVPEGNVWHQGLASVALGSC
eukprot:COSAG02_NODE_35244_length_471_cov_1.094086_1_plen_72_part_00